MTDLLFDRSPAAAHPFLRSALAELVDHGVTLIVVPDLQVRYHDGMLSAGYFDNDPLTFAVALGKPFADWFLVFVHEFCHFRQHLDDAAAFTRAGLDIQALFEWVGGERELNPDDVQRLARVARDLEADCERRVLANLDAFGIAHLIDPEVYAQKANSYFNFYNYVAAHRCWYEGGREPYSQPEVWTRFPTTLVVEDGMTPEREALFARCVPAAIVPLKVPDGYRVYQTLVGTWRWSKGVFGTSTYVDGENLEDQDAAIRDAIQDAERSVA